MSCAKTNQLHALLAMPASLRLVLVGNPTRLRLSPTYIPLINVRHYSSKAKRKGDPAEIAAFQAHDLGHSGTAPVRDISHTQLHEMVSLALSPDLPLRKGLENLFYIRNKALLVDATADFYLLKKNTLIPEVCILGRSNVGKSTFVNGLAHRFRKDMAPTSKKAGRTKTMMTYGFGPPPGKIDLPLEPLGKEKLPKFSFYVVDMPGYGQNSLKVWGDNIKLYLEKRKNLKGAIVLIDGQVGPKQTDSLLLTLLCDLEIKTTIVLTKADHCGEWINRLRLTCRKLNKLIGDIRKERVEKNWTVDQNIYVTACGAKDTHLLHSTLETARIAIARLAGFVIDVLPDTDRDKKWVGKPVTFEMLGNIMKEDSPVTYEEAEVKNKANEEAPKTSVEAGVKNEKNNSALATSTKAKTSSFADLERAAAQEHRVRTWATRSSSRPSLDTWSTPGSRSRTFVRRFHGSAARPQQQKRKSTKQPQKSGTDIFDAFINSLKSSNTKGNYARNVRDQHDRKRQPPPVRTELRAALSKRAQYLFSRFPEITDQTHSLKLKRQSLTDLWDRAEMQGSPSKPTQTKQKSAKKNVAPIDDDEWPVMPTPGGKNRSSAASDNIMTPDAFKAMVTSPNSSPNSSPEESGMKKKKNKGKGKGKGKGKNAKAEKLPPPVDPFEAKFGQAFTTSKKQNFGSSSF
ncbi:uncharacterized protein GGS22DRAFT_154270 [Annulohypoxylon maeteangense]|uniref:uncharacterized protein n=1 Tax=Annulohypoxylon maeteangense TaxID=1927788 RepID=UPI002007493B|nr:uncharacterized protein GGS22DRAFT_154270 [Annulohypoxylon maeteangense]KAI0887786.1 hypothetical protein GGS22DRAFT_154270 [Annulohypoxylon maeteangense]